MYEWLIIFFADNGRYPKSDLKPAGKIFRRTTHVQTKPVVERRESNKTKHQRIRFAAFWARDAVMHRKEVRGAESSGFLVEGGFQIQFPTQKSFL